MQINEIQFNAICSFQVIGCGDFKQLPPVPDKFLNDEGKHCFESSMFESTFPHHVNLTKVHQLS
jgi:hypothetical protein